MKGLVGARRSPRAMALKPSVPLTAEENDMVLALLRSLLPTLYVEISLALSIAGRAVLKPLRTILSLQPLPPRLLVRLISG